MRLLDTFGLVDWPVNRIVLAFKLGVILRPHAVDDLAGLSEHAHPVAKLGEAKAISPPLVLVPACSDARRQPAVACDVHRGGDLGIQRRVTVTVTADHLPNLDILCVAGEGGRDRPALEAGLKLRCGDSMEVVEDPDGIPPSLIGHACDPRHGLVLFDGIVDLRQVHAPPLRYEDSESDWHHLSPFPLTSSARAQVESLPISHEGAWWSRPAPPLVGTFISTLDPCAGIVAYLLWCGKVCLPGSLREGILPRPAISALPGGVGGDPRHRVDNQGSPDGDHHRLLAHPGDDRPLGSAIRSHGLRRLQGQPRGGLPLSLRGGPHRGQPQERYSIGGGRWGLRVILPDGERLVLSPSQELHLVIVRVPKVHDAEDLGGLGVLYHHHVALGVVGLYGHTEVVAGLVFVSHLKRRLHRSLLLTSPVTTQLQRVVGVKTPWSQVTGSTHTPEDSPDVGH